MGRKKIEIRKIANDKKRSVRPKHLQDTYYTLILYAHFFR
jgi:hypothetical protein